MLSPRAAKRFWIKVQIRKDSECWPWIGHLVKSGYGEFSIGRRRYRAHRLMLELCGVSIPPGLIVMHSCDNPPCVNPRHLLVGTQAPNMRDMVLRGRHVWSPGRTKLTPTQVLAIRQRVGQGESRQALAHEFGVHPQTIYHIKTRRYWPNL